jgi:hypothetical protein
MTLRSCCCLKVRNSGDCENSRRSDHPRGTRTFHGHLVVMPPKNSGRVVKHWRDHDGSRRDHRYRISNRLTLGDPGNPDITVSIGMFLICPTDIACASPPEDSHPTRENLAVQTIFPAPCRSCWTRRDRQCGLAAFARTVRNLGRRPGLLETESIRHPGFVDRLVVFVSPTCVGVRHRMLEASCASPAARCAMTFACGVRFS